MSDGKRPDGRAEIIRLMSEYSGSLVRMCTLYLKDASLAQDAVQDAFLKAYRHLGNRREESSEKAWLSAIAANVCRDYLRSAWLRRFDRRKDISDLPEQPDDFTFPDNTVLTEVKGLPPKYREVILLRYYQGMRLKEVADALRLSDSAVRKRLSHANALLRDRLKEWYDDEES